MNRKQIDKLTFNVPFSSGSGIDCGRFRVRPTATSLYALEYGEEWTKMGWNFKHIGDARLGDLMDMREAINQVLYKHYGVN